MKNHFCDRLQKIPKKFQIKNKFFKQQNNMSISRHKVSYGSMWTCKNRLRPAFYIQGGKFKSICSNRYVQWSYNFPGIFFENCRGLPRHLSECPKLDFLHLKIPYISSYLYLNVIEFITKFFGKTSKKLLKNLCIVKNHYFVQNLFNKVLEISKKSYKLKKIVNFERNLRILSFENGMNKYILVQ